MTTINTHKRAARLARIKAQAIGHTTYQRASLRHGEGIASKRAAHIMRHVYRDALHSFYRVNVA